MSIGEPDFELLDRLGRSLAGLRLLTEVSEVCSEEAGLQRIGEATLRRICAFHKWRLGRLHSRGSDGRLSVLAAYQADDRDHTHPFPPGFTGNSEATRSHFERVIREERAVWQVTDFDGATDHPFTAVYVPTLGTEGLAGVLELISESRSPPSDEVRAAVEAVARRLGRVIEKRRIDAEIARRAAEDQEHASRELHDTVSELAGLALSGDALTRRLRKKGDGEAEEAEALFEEIRGAIRTVRMVSDGLLPLKAERGGLAAALERLARGVQARHGVECVCRAASVEAEADTARQLYLIAKDAVCEAAESSDGAGELVVSCGGDGSRVRVEVRHGGELFSGDGDGRIGNVSIMRRRADSIDGVLRVERGRSGGTVVRCEAPCRVESEG